MPGKVAKLESLIGHKFRDLALLERAVTHRSWAYENIDSDDEEVIRDAENESMEFLGDSVLGLVIAEQLFSSHPKEHEGNLTLMKHHLVSTATLAKIAETLELGEFIRVGKGEEKSGGRKKMALLANTLEAVIAAVFLDGGYSAARVFINTIFSTELRAATPRNSIDYKTLLQELLQADKLAPPKYSVIKTDGPPHARRFTVEAEWKSGRSQGEGNSIKSAEMKAAEDAYNELNSAKNHPQKNFGKAK